MYDFILKLCENYYNARWLLKFGCSTF